jgi:hypothetical protein
MPYNSYGAMGGPAEWAAQQQAQQSDNFNRLISLFVNLKQAQQEQDWKQKEFGLGQQKYADAIRQQGVENANADRTYGLNKSNIETDNARQAGEVTDRAENNKRARELQEDSIKNNAAYRQSLIDAKKASEAAGAEERRNKLLASQHAALAANALKIMAQKKKAIADEMKLAMKDSSLGAIMHMNDPNYTDNKLAPFRAKSEAIDAEMASVLDAQRSALNGNAFYTGYVDHLNGVINGKDEQKDTGILGQFANLLGLGAEQAKKGKASTGTPSPQVNANKPDQFGFVMGQKRKGKDNKVYEYAGNDQWRPIN